MKITTLVAQSFNSIWSNKGRSSLTILGIVIGIAAVISLVALGNGLQSNVTNRLSNLDAKRITIRSQDPERQTAQRQRTTQGRGGAEIRGGFTFGGGNTETLTEADYQLVLKTANITAASPEMSTEADVTKTADADTATAYNLTGIDSSYLSLQELSMKSGSFLTSDQVKNSDAVVVLGQTVADELFGENDPINQKLYIKEKEFTVIGVLNATENASTFNNPADGIFTGYKTWLSVNGKEKFSSIIADASSEETVAAAADAAKATLLANHSITDETKADVATSTSKDLLSTISDVTGSFTTTLAGIAAISLLVGGIGIMNIMLVTVTERTREIGLRRAIGAKTKHILLQFLTESLLLTLLGGAIGLGLGMIFSQYAGQIINFGPGVRGPGAAETVQAIVDLKTIIMAIGISAGIGIVFGLFPAIKASKLDPIEALRYE